MKPLQYVLYIFLLIIQAEAVSAHSLNPKNGALCFTENKGQVTDQYYHPRTDIDFKLGPRGISIFIGKGMISYQWSKIISDNYPVNRHALQNDIESSTPASVEFYRMEVALVGADLSSKPIAEEQADDHETYYTENTGPEGVIVHSFHKITYRNIYPNIDWVLYTRDNQLKYDFVVHPGGDAKMIKLRFSGTTSLQLDDALIATTPMGSIQEDKPYSYEATTGKTVASSFVLNDNVLSFETAPYKGTLVIDPTIAWSTYYGGTNDDWGEVITGDKGGSLYLMGTTLSTGNIATTGTYQSTASLGRDAFIAKFNTQGQRIWGTYYGGNQDENTTGGVCDKFGDIYITGYCGNSSTIASAGAHQTIYGGGTSDGFLAKFNASGQRIWSTFYGGSQEEISHSVTCDTGGNVYIGGHTASATNIASSGTYNGGVFDAFIAKFNTSGIRQWGFYYGGTSQDQAFSIAYDSIANSLYVSGYTGSASVMATPGTYQQNRYGLTGDGFLARFNTSGIRQWGTYYGGNSSEYIYEMAIGKSGEIYVAGTTSSTDTIASTGAYQPMLASSADCFLAKFSNGGLKLWGTYYGGNDNFDYTYAIIQDDYDHIYIAGSTASTNNIATTGSIKSVLTGPGDAFWAKFNTDGQRLYGSYFGGSSMADDYIKAAYPYGGKIFFAGYSANTADIATAGSFQPVKQGGRDAFLFRLDPDTTATLSAIPGSFCPGSSLTINYTTNTSFRPGNVFTAQLSDVNGSFATPLIIGSIISSTSGSINATIPVSVVQGTGYRIRIVASAPYFITDDNNANITIQYKQPVVNITANPSANVGPGKPVVFTANITNGGSTPSIQWRKNGVAIPAATNTTCTLITGTDFVSGDVLTVWVQSNDACADPDTAVSPQLPLNVNLGINDMQGKDGVYVYPNPTTGKINIVFQHTNGQLNIELLNITGKVVWSESRNAQNGVSRIEISLLEYIPAGSYILRINNNDIIRNRSIVIIR